MATREASYYSNGDRFPRNEEDTHMQGYGSSERISGRQSHHDEGYRMRHYSNNTSRNPIKAAKGYHGIVRKPTYFLTGETGPERVNITPQRKHKQHHKNFNIWNNHSRKNNLLGF